FIDIQRNDDFLDWPVQLADMQSDWIPILREPLWRPLFKKGNYFMSIHFFHCIRTPPINSIFFCNCFFLLLISVVAPAFSSEASTLFHSSDSLFHFSMKTSDFCFSRKGPTIISNSL